jgi:hypothetical protein
MVSLPPNPAVTPLCVHTLCPRNEQCVRYLTHWDAGTFINIFEGGDTCKGFLPEPPASRTKEQKRAHYHPSNSATRNLENRTRTGHVLPRWSE